jgi:hypothetical protein
MSEEKLMEQCSELSASELSTDDRNRIEKEITKGSTGQGVIYRGKHYHLKYSPLLDNFNLVCIGFKLSIHDNRSQQPVIYPQKVRFKSGWFNRAPFTKRLEEAITEQKNAISLRDKDHDEREAVRIKLKEEHELAIIQHVEKVKKCTIRLDQTMKAVVQDTQPKAEPGEN